MLLILPVSGSHRLAGRDRTFVGLQLLLARPLPYPLGPDPAESLRSFDGENSPTTPKPGLPVTNGDHGPNTSIFDKMKMSLKRHINFFCGFRKKQKTPSSGDGRCVAMAPQSPEFTKPPMFFYRRLQPHTTRGGQAGTVQEKAGFLEHHDVLGCFLQGAF